MLFDVVDGIVGILHYIVQQCGHDRRGTETDFLADNLCNCDRMHDVRLARTTAHAMVSRFGKLERPEDNLDLLAVVAAQISIQKILVGFLD